MKAKIWKNRAALLFIAALWIIILGFFIQDEMEHGRRSYDIVSAGEFTATATVNAKDDWVGANISLKQAIHGTEGIKYRYIVKTDCPSWDFETRYMADEPIEWIDETSAVEVLIYDVQVWYAGTAYASGQYFTVPILGNLASENISRDEWQENLIKQAYQAYVSDMSNSRQQDICRKVFVFGIPIWFVIWVFCPQKPKKKKNEENA